MNSNEFALLDVSTISRGPDLYDEDQCLLSDRKKRINMKEKIRRWLNSRNFTIDVLAAAFGIGSWVAINGLWVELPLLVQELPEGWSLPSYLSVIIQIANLGPLTYGILSRLFPNKVTQSRSIWVILAIGVLASILMPIFWDETAVIFGAEHSVALFSLSLALSIVDCTSSVLFLPYIGLFGSIYLPSYLLGEGLSALLPSLVAIIQGVGQLKCVNSTDPENPGLVEQMEPPRFSTEIFFITLAVMMFLSATAFSGLEFLPTCKKERETEHEEEKKRKNSETIQLPAKYGSEALLYLLGLQLWMSFWANGVLVSLQTYSAMPYGNVAYHWAAILFNTANPLACLLALYKPCLNLIGNGILVVAGSLVSSYLLWTASTSPYPPLIDTNAGGPVVVTAWFLYSALTCYAKVSVACMLREPTWKIKENISDSGRSETEKRLFKYGAVTQCGSLVGSIITFVLVNVLVLFEAAYPCSSS